MPSRMTFITVLFASLAVVALQWASGRARRSSELAKSVDALSATLDQISVEGAVQFKQVKQLQQNGPRVAKSLSNISNRLMVTQGELRTARQEVSSAEHVITVMTSSVANSVGARDLGDLTKHLGETRSELQQASSITANRVHEIESQMRETESIIDGIAQLPTQSNSMPATIYNAVFETDSGTPLQFFEENKPAEIRFFIGRPNSQNGIPADKSDVSKILLDEQSAIPLIVTLHCNICSHGDLTSEQIEFFPDSLTSTEARFPVEAISLGSTEARREGMVVFDVSSEGREYGHIPVTLWVVSPNVNAGGTPAEVKKQVSNFYVPVRDAKPDIVFKFSYSGNILGLKITIPNEELKKKLTEKEQWEQRHFLCPNANSEAIPHRQEEVFDSLSLMMQSRSPQYQAILKYISDVKARTISQSAMQMDPSDEDVKNFHDIFRKIGHRTYEDVFTCFDEANNTLSLSDFMKSFESEAPEGLRIRIDEPNTFLPWQMLLPPGDDAFARYWGIKYRLAVNPTLRDSSLPFAGELKLGSSSALMFATYSSPESRDVVTRLGEQSRDVALKQFSKLTFVPARSKDEFAAGIKGSRPSLDLLFAFTHASNGWVKVVEHDVPTHLKDDRGQRLIFSVDPKDYFNSEDFRNAADTSKVSPFWTERPLVFLNACETGAVQSGNTEDAQNNVFYTTTPQIFVTTLLGMGAGGIIVTQASVWDYFAKYFADDLFEEIAAGKDIETAIWDVRRKYVRYNLPIGLLYAYYGDSSTRVSVQQNSSGGNLTSTH